MVNDLLPKAQGAPKWCVIPVDKTGAGNGWKPLTGPWPMICLGYGLNRRMPNGKNCMA